MSADSFDPTSGVPLSSSRRTDDEFEDTFHRLWPIAVATARRLVSEQTAAEDVASEAFARALSRWSRVRRLDHRDAWILRVTINLALDELRRRRPDGGLATELCAVDDEGVELRLVLDSALRRLPRRQRQVLLLRYVVGLPEMATASALGIGVATVNTHAERGLARLRGRLDPEAVR